MKTDYQEMIDDLLELASELFGKVENPIGLAVELQRSKMMAKALGKPSSSSLSNLLKDDSEEKGEYQSLVDYQILNVFEPSKPHVAVFLEPSDKTAYTISVNFMAVVKITDIDEEGIYRFSTTLWPVDDEAMNSGIEHPSEQYAGRYSGMCLVDDEKHLEELLRKHTLRTV